MGPRTRSGSRQRDTTTALRRLATAANLTPRLPPDPGRAGLRRSARAALVVPLAFATTRLITGDVQLTTFVAFGCLALVVMADFGGARRPRSLAYAAATGIGAALIALGTLASFSPWAGAVVMLLVGFAVSFTGAFGGYAAAAQTALLLAFVLAVTIAVPDPPAALVPRLGGWLITGVVSLLAGVFLWPRFERRALRQQAAAACRALAHLVQALRIRPEPGEVAPAQRAAREATANALEANVATPKRPAGPALRDRAFVELLGVLQQILAFLAQPAPNGRPLSARHPCLLEGDRLAAAVVQTMTASADVLTGGAPPDLPALEAARRAHREALERWAAEALRAASTPEAVLDGLDADDSLRVVAYLTLALGSNAAITAGAHLDAAVPVPAGVPTEGGPTGALRRVVEAIRDHLTPDSSVLQNSLRVAVALALAVLVARLLQLDHAFWVVLGTLSALRSNALATGWTTLQAIAGTVAGFALSAIFLVLVGTTSSVLWALLPGAIFLAAYAASALGFVAGQAAFTIAILILFNIIAPAGLRLGVARLVDWRSGSASASS